MNQTRAMLLLGNPVGDLYAFKPEGGRLKYYMGGDSPAPAPSSTSQTTSNIPDWAIPYATRVLGNAEALTNINQNPYQQYQGNRVADFNPLQNQSFNNIAGMTTNAGTGNAMNQTQDAYNRSANAGPYNAQNFGNQYGSGPQFQNMGLGYLAANAPQLQNYQMGPASQVHSQNFGQQSAQDYMSPYQQNVTDFQKQEAVKDYSRALPGMGAQASGAGAFGGTRHALVAAEGQRNLQTQLGGIQAAGSQNAYQNAQQQFNADQARRQQAQMSNQQAGLTVGQANLGANLQTQALGSGQSMQAQLANQGAYGQMQGLGMQQNLSANQQAMQNAQLQAQYGLAGQQAGEASRQFGANYGLQNRQQALAAAGQLGTLGQQQYAQQQGINAAQQQAGAQIQAQEQQGISNRYQDFLNNQNYPYKQLGFMSDILRGTPTSGGAQSMYQAPPSGISQFAGLAGGLGSLYGGYNQAMKAAAGGEIKGYAEGGAVAFNDGGDVVPLPNAAEFMVAKKANEHPDKNDTSGLGALLKAAGMGADLQNLIVAQKQVKTKQQEDTIRKLQNQLAQATGMPEQQNTTVEEDVSNMLQREVESRQGGIADLDTGNLGDNYAGGGIVAFDDGGDVRHFQAAGRVSGDYNAELQERPDSLDWRKPPTPLTPAEQAALQERINTLKRPGINIDPRLAREVGAVPANIGKNILEGLGFKNLVSGNALAADAPAAVPTDPTRGIELGRNTPSDNQSGAPAPSTSPLVRPPSGAPAVDSADSDHTKHMATLQGSADEGLKLLRESIQPREVNKTAGEHAAALREQENAFLKARNLPTVEESMKERLDNLATAGREARNNRDVDRWMAAAQGFFAMAGGKSQYAMQNMAEGLNIGVKELRAVEQDYRKIDQLQKDKAELLKEATRQETKNDFAKGDALRKEIDDRNTRIDATKITIAERLVHYSGDAMGRAIAAKSANDARKAADAARAQAAEIAAQDRRDRAGVIADQKYADMQVRLERQHPLILKGELPSKLTDLGNARLQLATNPTNPKFIKSVGDLTAEVDRMQDQVANDTAKKAKQFIKAGNSEWGTLQTSGGTK